MAKMLEEVTEKLSMESIRSDEGLTLDTSAFRIPVSTLLQCSPQDFGKARGHSDGILI